MTVLYQNGFNTADNGGRGWIWTNDPPLCEECSGRNRTAEFPYQSLWSQITTGL